MCWLKFEIVLQQATMMPKGRYFQGFPGSLRVVPNNSGKVRSPNELKKNDNPEDDETKLTSSLQIYLPYFIFV